MNPIKAVALGIVQGLTEFLPVSSSGHLVLFQKLMGLNQDMLTFDIVLHAGTLAAVMVYYWRDIWRMVTELMWMAGDILKGKSPGMVMDYYPLGRLLIYLLLATVPTGLMAILFHDAVQSLFGSLVSVAVAWILTGIFLVTTRKYSGNRSFDLMTHQDAFVIGLAQGVSLIPGISRSGSTIIAGMFCGIEKKDAARFSFLLSIPAIIGANILELSRGIENWQMDLISYASGFAAAAFVGYLSIAVLLKLIEKGNFFLFGFYCFAIGLFTLGYCVMTGAAF